jgi:hypothetical protein
MQVSMNLSFPFSPGEKLRKLLKNNLRNKRRNIFKTTQEISNYKRKGQVINK